MFVLASTSERDVVMGETTGRVQVMQDMGYYAVATTSDHARNAKRKR